MAGKPCKRARKLLVAGRVLELFQKGGYLAVVEEFGEPRRPGTRTKMGAKQLLEWATKTFLSDEARQAGSARVIDELHKVAHSDARNLFDKDGRIKPLSELDDDAARAVASVEITDKGVVKVKAWDKNSALASLMKIYKMGTEKHEHSGPGGGPIEIADISPAEARRRIEFIFRSAVEE